MSKTLKFLFATLFMCMTVSLTSCSSDDDEPEATIDDWYSECTSVSGGGFSPQKCSLIMTDLNTNPSLMLGPNYVWRNIDKDQAVYYFDRQVEDLRSFFSDGRSDIDGTLSIVVALKNSKGKSIKTNTLKVTTTGCSIQ